MEEYQRSSGQHRLSYYLDAASSPHCVGLHRCTVRDYQPWNTNYHRRGLLKADDTELRNTRDLPCILVGDRS